MATKTKKKRAGKVGITPRGDWSAAYNSGNGYAVLDLVLHNHDSWVSKVNGNTDEPSASSEKWQKHSDGGEYAHNQGDIAKAKGETAETQGAYAEEQGDRAKDYNDHPWELRSDNWVWGWDGTQMVRLFEWVNPEDIPEEVVTEAIAKISADNILGPTYDDEGQGIIFPASTRAVYDSENRGIHLG